MTTNCESKEAMSTTLSPSKPISIELVDVVGLNGASVHGARVKTAAIAVPIGEDGKRVEFMVSARTIEQLDAAVGRMLGTDQFALNAEHIRSSILIMEGDLKIDDEL